MPGITELISDPDFIKLGNEPGGKEAQNRLIQKVTAGGMSATKNIDPNSRFLPFSKNPVHIERPAGEENDPDSEIFKQHEKRDNRLASTALGALVGGPLGALFGGAFPAETPGD